MNASTKQYCVALDVGGTFVKCGLVASDGSSMKESFQTAPIQQKSAETILSSFVDVITHCFCLAKTRRRPVAGICVSIAGPFDMERGISLMKHKLAPLYGVNLKREFIRRLGLTDGFAIRFDPDAWAFLRGEAWRGAGKGFNRIIGVTIGTGLGSAFTANGQLLIEGAGVPRFGWLGGLPYQAGILDSRISRPGIIARYRELAEQGAEGLDVKEIAALAGRKDRAGVQVFRETGEILGSVLRSICSEFQADCLVFGGQISKSFSLFADPIRAELRGIPTLKKVAAGRSIDFSALYGAAQVLFGPATPHLLRYDEQTLKELGAFWE